MATGDITQVTVTNRPNTRARYVEVAGGWLFLFGGNRRGAYGMSISDSAFIPDASHANPPANSLTFTERRRDSTGVILNAPLVAGLNAQIYLALAQSGNDESWQIATERVTNT